MTDMSTDKNDQTDKQAQRSRIGGQGRSGFYSPNQCIFFTAFALLILIPFLGQRLDHPAQSIENLFLKNIYRALAAPAVAVTEASPAAAVIPVLRNSFIRLVGLKNRGEWDSFFYRRRAYDGETSEFYALTGAQGYAESLSGFSDNLSDREGIPMELFGQVSRETLHNVALPVPHSAQTPLRMLFFGDSQMHSIAAGMARALGADGSVTVEELSVHSSGFLRSDYYNWPQKLEAVFTAQKDGTRFDAAVAFLGMNDYQDMWAADGIILIAGSPEWEEVYRKMVRAHLDIVLRFVPRLYWLGLPTVRKTVYDEKIRYLDTVHRSIAEEYDPKKLVKISLKEFVAEYGTGYIGSIKPDGGSRIPLMQADGVHYTIEGGEYLMKKFIERLHRDYVFESLRQ